MVTQKHENDDYQRPFVYVASNEGGEVMLLAADESQIKLDEEALADRLVSAEKLKSEAETREYKMRKELQELQKKSAEQEIALTELRNLTCTGRATDVDEDERPYEPQQKL